jgi:hypothetical protein
MHDVAGTLCNGTLEHRTVAKRRDGDLIKWTSRSAERTKEMPQEKKQLWILQ